MPRHRLLFLNCALFAVCTAFAGSRAHAAPQAALASCGQRLAVVDVYAVSSPQDLIYRVCAKNGRVLTAISVPEHWGLLGFDHDNAGRLYVLQAYAFHGRQIGAVLIYDGRWKTIGLPPGLVGSMAVERRQGVAYIYHNVIGDSSHSWISAVSAQGKVTHSFPVRPAGAGAQMLFDSNGHLVVLSSGQENLLVLDPRTGKHLRSTHAYGCALAAGNDGLFYGANCYGTIATYDPRSFHIVALRSYSHGSVVGIGANELPKIAIDTRHTVFFVDEHKEELRIYRYGSAVPFRTYAHMAVRDLALGSDDNAYVLIAPENPKEPRFVDVYENHSAALIRRYRFPRDVYPQRMTIER